ncbi:MAG TPA: NfeD family protein [Gaiellales bacterium]|jgi:membrane protein implicated in regulation of membrane protease activity|nr:NfeD family protein [Gaiellales bacterium]
MQSWVVWVVIAVALLVAEATTTAFVAIYFGVAALAAALLAAAGASVAVQMLAFGGLAVGSLALTRPALRRATGRVAGLRTGVDAMQGKIGLVTLPIAELEPGQVKVGGEIWTARSYYDGESIPAGTRVEVVKVEGVTALVIAAPSPHTDEIGDIPDG